MKFHYAFISDACLSAVFHSDYLRSVLYLGKLAFPLRRHYNNAVEIFRKVSTILSCSYQIETIGGFAMELPACPVETTLMLIGDKWKVLTAQLRDMEEKGLLKRKVYAEVPPRVEYTLTETGYSLKPILDAMWAWGTDYKVKNG